MTMKLRVYAYAVAVLLMVGGNAAAQQPNDPLAEIFFTPELIMQHQQAIGLTDDQKNFMKTELRKVQLQFTELQFQLQDEMEALTSMVKKEQIDEAQVMTQLDKVLSLEREVKKLQFSLVVRLKNKLTREQQEHLQEIRNRQKR